MQAFLCSLASLYTPISVKIDEIRYLHKNMQLNALLILIFEQTTICKRIHNEKNDFVECLFILSWMLK